MRILRLAVCLLLTAFGASASNDLTGVVVAAGGKALPKAHVYIYTAFPRFGVSAVCPSCYRDCGKHVEAGAKGTFHVASLDPALVFNILAVADGYEPAFAEHVDPLKGKVTIALNRRLASDETRLVRGVVVDPDGKPVVGAKAEPNGLHTKFRRPDGTWVGSIGYGDLPGLDKLSITNEKGEFALRMPDADGKLDVRITSRSFAPEIDRVLVPGEVRTIHLVEGAAITGHVMKGGEPLSGVRVVFAQPPGPSGDYLGRAEIATNEKGIFVMTNLAPDHKYFVYPPMEGLSGVAEAKEVQAGANKSTSDAGTLEVVRGRRVRGHVVVPEGVSIPPGSVVTLATGYGDLRNTALRADRTFAFDAVPAGAVRISGELPHATRRSRAVVKLPAGGDVDDVALVFE